MDYAKVPQEYRDYLITRIKTIAKMNITESRLPQDGAIKETLDELREAITKSREDAMTPDFFEDM